MPPIEVMLDALTCLVGDNDMPVCIQHGEYGLEYSSMPKKVTVCEQVVHLFKAVTLSEFNLVLDQDGILFDGATRIGSSEDKEQFFQKVCAIQMWFLNPWRSLDFVAPLFR